LKRFNVICFEFDSQDKKLIEIDETIFGRTLLLIQLLLKYTRILKKPHY